MTATDLFPTKSILVGSIPLTPTSFRRGANHIRFALNNQLYSYFLNNFFPDTRAARPRDLGNEHKPLFYPWIPRIRAERQPFEWIDATTPILIRRIFWLKACGNDGCFFALRSAKRINNKSKATRTPSG
jgi:hypothetical protein